MNNVLPHATVSRPSRFLDLLPEPERKQAAAAFIRAVRRTTDSEEAVELLTAWLRADYIQATEPLEKQRVLRLGVAIRDHRESALSYAKSTAIWLKGQLA